MSPQAATRLVPVAKTGNLRSRISARSRTVPLVTRPAIPLRLAANVAVPPHDTPRSAAPASITMTLPGGAASTARTAAASHRKHLHRERRAGHAGLGEHGLDPGRHVAALAGGFPDGRSRHRLQDRERVFRTGHGVLLFVADSYRAGHSRARIERQRHPVAFGESGSCRNILDVRRQPGPLSTSISRRTACPRYVRSTTTARNSPLLASRDTLSRSYLNATVTGCSNFSNAGETA